MPIHIIGKAASKINAIVRLIFLSVFLFANDSEIDQAFFFDIFIWLDRVYRVLQEYVY